MRTACQCSLKSRRSPGCAKVVMRLTAVTARTMRYRGSQAKTEQRNRRGGSSSESITTAKDGRSSVVMCNLRTLIILPGRERLENAVRLLNLACGAPRAYSGVK